MKGEKDEAIPEGLQASSSTLDDDGSRRGSKLNAGSRRATTSDEFDLEELTKHLCSKPAISKSLILRRKSKLKAKTALLDDSDDDYSTLASRLASLLGMMNKSLGTSLPQAPVMATTSLLT
jgi:hypothetical protein